MIAFFFIQYFFAKGKLILKTDGELKELYGQQYAERLSKTQAHLRFRRLITNMRLRPQDSVADVGCGSGMLMPYVAPFVNSYVGVDFSQPFIEIANAKKNALGIRNARFECASIQEFCRKNVGAFNIVFAMDFSEHVYDENWLQILMSIKTSLVNGGILYVHTPNARFFIEIMKKNNFIMKQFPEHVAVRTVEENVELLQKAGFRVSRTLLVPHYNILRTLHLLSFLPFIGNYFKARILIEAIST
jgi:cyclopropane fatty-acyl-phospholipid synthase-like methyltransferase